MYSRYDNVFWKYIIPMVLTGFMFMVDPTVVMKWLLHDPSPISLGALNSKEKERES